MDTYTSTHVCSYEHMSIDNNLQSWQQQRGVHMYFDAYTYIYTYTRIFIRIHICNDAPLEVFVFTCVFLWIYMCTCTCIQWNTRVYLFVAAGLRRYICNDEDLQQQRHTHVYFTGYTYMYTCISIWTHMYRQRLPVVLATSKYTRVFYWIHVNVHMHIHINTYVKTRTSRVASNKEVHTCILCTHVYSKEHISKDKDLHSCQQQSCAVQSDMSTCPHLENFLLPLFKRRKLILSEY